MKKLLPVVLLALTAVPALAVTIFPHAARGYAGRVVTVRGVVDGVHDERSVVYLYMDGRAPRNGLTVAVYPGAVEAFSRSTELPGKTLDVTGRIVMVAGTPRIEARTARQIIIRE